MYYGKRARGIDHPPTGSQFLMYILTNTPRYAACIDRVNVQVVTFETHGYDHATSEIYLEVFLVAINFSSSNLAVLPI